METQSARSTPPASAGTRDTSTGSRDGATQTASARADARPAAGPRIILGGLPIRIQDPRGAVRSGLAPDGTPWQQEQKSHHGILEGTEHASQGPIHVFVHPGATQIAENARTFVVSHVDPATGRLTAPMVMLGFESPKQAQKAYQANFPRDRRKVGPIQEMPFSQLRDRVNALRQSEKPAAAAAAEPSPSGHGRPQAASPNTAEARTGLRQGPLAPLVDRLIDTGQVVIHDTEATLPVKDPEGGRTQGLVDTDGTIHLVAENLTAKTALPVLLHEIFHWEVKKLLGDRKWQTLLNRLGENYDAALRRAHEGRRGDSRSERFWDGAFRRVKDAGVSKAHAVEEVAAYAIENYASAPPGVRGTVESLVGTAKAWVYRHSGVQMGAITPSQLVSLTQAALRASQQDRARTASGNDAVRYSKAPKKPRPPRDVESEVEIPVHLLSPADENKAYYASSAADGVRLRNQLLALAIAGGHAFKKHVVGVDNPQGSEFVGLDIRTRAQFADHVENTINQPDRNKSLERDREHFYDRKTNTAVMKNPKDPDGGTAFRPKDGELYIDRLEEKDGKNY